MKRGVLATIVLFIVTVCNAQVAQKPGEATIITTTPAKATEDPDMGGENVTDTSINISPRLRNDKGASVFGGKFKYTTVIIHKTGTHTLYAAGMNGKLKYLYAKDTRGNKIPATYTENAACMACITLENGLKHYYIIDCDDVPIRIK